MEVKDDLQNSGADNISVFVRIRPSRDSQERICAFATSNTSIKLDSKVIGISQQASAARGEEVPKSFGFDYVARSDVSQESFFDRVGRPMADSCLSGYNGCLFAYGQTGSGKTFTIQGPDGPHRAEDKGLTVRILEYIFRKLGRSKSKNPNFDFVCECSYLELYQENLQDLLAMENKKLELREDLKKGVYVENVTKIAIRSAEGAESLFLNGTKKRHVASSKANNQSSRSHAIFTIYIQTQEVNETGITAIKSSMLHIVDLAGSERQKNTEASGKRLQEAGTINRSLTHLGKTIRALVDQAENKHVYVPYRESKLTFLLKQSLGGNSKTAIIATVDPGLRSYSETLSTLRFADRAKMIRNNAIVNEQSSGSVSQLQAELKKLRADYQTLLKTTSSTSLNIPSLGSGAHIRASSSTSSSSSSGASSSGAQISPRDRQAGSSSSHSPDSPDGGLERDETIYRLEDLLRAMASQVKNASIERDNFTHKIRELQQLLVVKEYYVESAKLIARLREEKIARIQRCGEDEEFAKSLQVSEEEISALQCEIEALQHQLSHHPDVIRLSIENMELKEILEQYEAHYKPEGELSQLRSLCDKLSSQMIKLSTDKAKLIELLKGEEDATSSDGSSSGVPSLITSGSVTMSKLNAWSHEVKVEQLEAEIERLRMDAIQELSATEEKDIAHKLELDELKLQLKTMQEQLSKMETLHQEEKDDIESRYCQLSDYVREKYETQIKALYERLEHEHVSSVTVLTMEKQLSTQTDEYVKMKKLQFEMQSDLRALKNILETSFIPLDLDAELGVEPNFANESAPTSNDSASNDSLDSSEPNLILFSSTPKKTFLSAATSSRTPSKSPWTPNRSVGSMGASTPSGTSRHSIPRLAIAKIQELSSMVADYTSKIAELENTLAEIDGEHFAITKKQKDKLRARKERIGELEGVVTDYQERDAASRERLEELGTQLDVNNQLMEEKEAEALRAQNDVEALQRQVAALNAEKEALKAQTTTLVTQLKQQKDDQVLAMMKRQDELETELFEARQLLDDEMGLTKDLQTRLAEAQEHSGAADAMLTQSRALIDSLTSDVSTKDEKLKTLKVQLADSRAEQQSLTSRLEVLENAEQSLQEIRRENDDLTSAMKESCRALREKQNQFLHLEELRRREQLELEQEKDTAAHAFEQLQAENDTLAQQLNQAHRDLRATQATLTTSQQRISDMSRQLTIEQARVSEFKIDMASLQHQLTTERAKVMKMDEKLEESAQALKRLTAEREELAADLEDAVSSLQSKSGQLNALLTEGTEEEKALRLEKDDLSAELKLTKSQLLTVREELTTSSSELFETHERMADRETELETMIDTHLAEISDLRQTLTADRRRFEESNGRYIQEHVQMDRQLKELRELAMRKSKEAEEFAITIAKHEATIQALAVDTVVQQKDEIIEELRMELEEVREANEMLRSGLDETAAVAARKSTELLHAKSAAADLASQKHNKIQYVMTMKSENNELRTQVDELRAKLRHLEIAAGVTPSSSSVSLAPSSSSLATSSEEAVTKPKKATSKPSVAAKPTTAPSSSSASSAAPSSLSDITNTNKRTRVVPPTGTTTIASKAPTTTKTATAPEEEIPAKPAAPARPHTRSASQRTLNAH